MTPEVAYEDIIVDADDFQFQISQYLNWRKTVDRSMSTFRQRVTALKSFAAFLKLDDEIRKYKAPKPPKGIPHPLKEGIEGVIRLIEAAETVEQRALIALCGLCGARISEARAVMTYHVDPADALIMLGGKHGHYRKVPMSRVAMGHLLPAVIEAITAGRSELLTMCDRTARDIVKNLSRIARLEGDPASHDLRATIGTYLYRKTKDLRLVQDFLGHEDSKTTETYTEVEMVSMRDAVQFD